MGGMMYDVDRVLRRLDALQGHVDIRLDGLESRLTERLEQIMTEQQDIDAATQALTGMVSDVQNQSASLATAVEGIQAYIAAHPDADTSALDAVVAQVSGAQSGLDAAVGNVQGVLPANPPSS
jgi:hypothetical protein